MLQDMLQGTLQDCLLQGCDLRWLWSFAIDLLKDSSLTKTPRGKAGEAEDAVRRYLAHKRKLRF